MFKCPHCLATAGQVQQEDDIIFCNQCLSTYLHGNDQDQEDYESPFAILPPKNYELPTLALRDQDEDDYKPNKRNVFDDDDDDDEDDDEDDFVYTPSKSPVRERTRARAPIRSKAKAPTTLHDRSGLPEIFRDVLPDVKGKKRTSHRDDQLAFSDPSDDDDDPEYLEDSKLKRKRKRAREEYTTTKANEADEESIQAYAQGRTVKKTRAIAKPKRSIPLQKFSPFLNFNKEMRGKIAQENVKVLEDSQIPQHHKLSQLVADAWKNMSEQDKKKFNQELSEQKVSVVSVACQKVPRPSGNGYIQYSQEHLPSLKLEFPDLKSVRDLSAIMSVRWKGLSQDKKDMFTAKAKKRKDDWIRENPEAHQQYLDKMNNKITATKKAKRDEKQRRKMEDAYQLKMRP